MAWIKNTNDATSRLYDADLDVDVEFSSNGTAQVSEDVAAELIDRYDAIEAHETGDSDNDSA